MARKSKYTRELLEPIIKRNQTWTGVLHELGLKMSGGNFRYIQGRARTLKISWEHFVGQSWARGLTKETDERVARMAATQRMPDHEVFIANSSYRTHKLSSRLISLGWEYECAICSLSEWLGQKITLQVDHINGVATDHRFENLRFLCPNCHSQTSTYGGNKAKKLTAKPKNFCVDCETEISERSTRCKSCAMIHSKPTKIIWPEIDDLLAMLEKSSYLVVSKNLGVSDNAIRKHIRNYTKQQNRRALSRNQSS